MAEEIGSISSQSKLQDNADLESYLTSNCGLWTGTEATEIWGHSGNRSVGQYGRDRRFKRLGNFEFIEVRRTRGVVIRVSGCQREKIRDCN